MSGLLVQDKDLVLPGQVLAEGMEYLPSGGDVIRDGEQLVALRVGVVNVSNRVVKLIPLTGKYIPKKNDYVIGRVESASLNGWQVDIGCAYSASLNVRDATQDYIERGTDLSKFFAVGDFLMTQIINVVGTKIIDLTLKGPGLRRLAPGRLVFVSSAKVPRIIGKQGSMVTLLKEKTNVKISVGQNGVVWLRGDTSQDELRVVKALELIERESYLSGLTDRVKTFLESEQ